VVIFGAFFEQACRLLSAYIDYKQCEGVAEVIVANNMVDGFRLILQTMGLANLKPNIVCMRYPEIWKEDKHSSIPGNFVSVINDCSISNKAVVIVKGLDEWPGEYQKQYGTIDLYWIVRDGGLMLLLSQLLRARDCFDSCRIRVPLYFLREVNHQ
jgi:potassium/chloride transporter 4/5/6